MAAHACSAHLIVGVDRLDYSKGLEERFLGFERFLARQSRPAPRGAACCRSPRVAATRSRPIRTSAPGSTRCPGRINGAFADIDWAPIRYVNRNYRRDELAGIYRAARVGLVTPLRDGMNLVAKEYVAAQDPDDPGVLILSRFAGAARQMTEALIVNPVQPRGDCPRR